MLIQHKAIIGMAACAMVCSMPEAVGGFAESSAVPASAVWTMPVLGFESGDVDLHGMDIRYMLGDTETSIGIDLLSQNSTGNGWGAFGADVKTVLGDDRPWTILDVPKGDKVYGSSYAPGRDLASWIDLVLDFGLTNSNLASAWNPSRLANDGFDIGRNNIYLDNIAAIPEPATYGLITIFGGALLLFRRRFKL